MDSKSLKLLLSHISTLDPHVFLEITPPAVLRCAVEPAKPWDPVMVERVYGLTLPQELKQLWNEASQIRLWEDVTYGQWGCVLWKPSELFESYKARVNPIKFLFDTFELVVGEFRGDSDLLVINCNPKQKRFGAVLIARTLEAEFAIVADSILEFIEKFIRHPGKKYWESPINNRAWENRSPS